MSTTTLSPVQETQTAPLPERAPLRRFLAIGAGVAIEITRDDLHATVVRVRPGGVKVLGSLTIPRFASQPAAEWGSVYAAFLRKQGEGHLAAHVMLPRESVTVRLVPMPGVADKDLEAALKYQIDSLHPYPEEDVTYAFARVGKTPFILTGITRRSVVDRYSELFTEAGIKVSAFTIAAASLYSAVRVLAEPPASGFLALGEADPATGEIEAYGESPTRPIFSTQLDLAPERAAGLALSELRLPQNTEPMPLREILPDPLAVPEDFQVDRGALGYATAIASACPWFALDANLLPADLRKSSSHLMYVPTIVLAVVAVLLAIGLFAYSGYEDQQYLKRLNGEIAVMQKRADRAAQLERTIAATRAKSQSLDHFRLRLKDDMNAINELTNLLAPPVWLNSLQLSRDSLSISGEAEHAEALLKVVDGSKQFKKSEFTLPIARGMTGEMFSIHAVREGVTQ